jgi:hypothetical protein
MRIFMVAVVLLAVWEMLVRTFLPPPPPYPYQNPAQITAEARQLSDNLEAYIKRWMDRQVPAQLPRELYPSGIRPEINQLFLQNADQVVPEDQWMVRKAEKINWRGVRGFFPDPNCTYLVLGINYAPFGSKMVIEGEFPYSRFFDIQASPSFDPRVYYYDGNAGAGEVPIVDADIEPLPGHVNPFRVGANRDAPNRRYRVTFDLAIGNAPRLNPAFRPPYYRGVGNHRVAGAIQYQGPWAAKESKYGHRRGVWDHGYLWLRYYAIDQDKGYLGGVRLPKVYYVLPDGRRYYLNANYAKFERQLNDTIPARATWPGDPPPFMSAKVGWHKQVGIFLHIAEGAGNAIGWRDKNYIRQLDLGVTGRGEDQPAPGNLEPSASSCTYINYLTRGISLGWGKVAVLTGKLPTFPDTRNGARRMERAQMRYWSITSYDANTDPNQKLPGVALTSVMDDQVVLDNQRRYVIVYSRAQDRPNNARPEAGVTWVNWGPTTLQSWTLRWLSVAPEWNMSIAPNEENLPWTTSAWSGKNFNPRLTAVNNQQGYLGEYQPEVHYMSRAAFEALGSQVSATDVPVWR